MTVIGRIHAAIATRNATCTAAYEAMGEYAPSDHYDERPWPFNTPADYLAYHHAQAAKSRARATYAAAVAAADDALVVAIEAAIAEGAGE